MHSETSFVDTTSQRRIQTCMNALEKLSKAWVAAKIAYIRFETILSGKGFRKNPQGAFEMVKRRQNAEDTMNGSAPSQYNSMTADSGGIQTVPPQFRDRLRQVVPDLTTGSFAQNDAPSSTMGFSTFQAMNLFSLAGSTGHDTNNPPQNSSYPASMPPDMSLNPSFDPQIPIPESHQEATFYDFRHLFPQGNL
jgi:hypothetical protein